MEYRIRNSQAGSKKDKHIEVWKPPEKVKGNVSILGVEMRYLVLTFKTSRKGKRNKKKKKKKTYQVGRLYTVYPDNKCLPPSHHHCHMIGHVFLDIAQETRRQDRNTSECNTSIVHPFVGLCVRELARRNDHLIRGLVARDARDLS